MFSTKRHACNYYCEICKKTGQLPNILGKFIIEHETGKVTCTGCKNVFKRQELRQVYSPVIF